VKPVVPREQRAKTPVLIMGGVPLIELGAGA
jgi:hypothetical protein